MRPRTLVVGSEAVLMRSLVSDFSEARLSRLLRSVVFMVQTSEKLGVPEKPYFCSVFRHCQLLRSVCFLIILLRSVAFKTDF